MNSRLEGTSSGGIIAQKMERDSDILHKKNASKAKKQG